MRPVSDEEMDAIQRRRGELETTLYDVDRLLQHIEWLHKELTTHSEALAAVLAESKTYKMRVGRFFVYEAMGGGVGVWRVDQAGRRIIDNG